MQDRFRTLLLHVFLLGSLTTLKCRGQEPLQLHLMKSVEVAGQSATLMIGPFQCDSEGDVFLMLPAGKALPTAILGISADGQKRTEFRLAAAPGFERSDILAYSVGRDDRVYVLSTRDGRDSYVVSFDKDGKFGSATKLEVANGTILKRIAASDGTSYFVGGMRTEGASRAEKQLDVILDAHGRIIGTVNISPDGGAPSGPRVSHLPSARSEEGSKETTEAQKRMDLSIVRGGQDGNFYFAPFDPKGPVFVVSPSGQVVRRIQLTAPTGAGFELLDLEISGGRLAVAYQGQPPPGGTAPVRIYVYEAQSGQLVAEYFHENWEIGVALACYSPNDQFTFIAADENGRMHLVTASAR